MIIRPSEGLTLQVWRHNDLVLNTGLLHFSTNFGKPPPPESRERENLDIDLHRETEQCVRLLKAGEHLLHLDDAENYFLKI